jgi:anaerobic ribonucleoside-triphosphate reductase activating protein
MNHLPHAHDQQCGRGVSRYDAGVLGAVLHLHAIERRSRANGPGVRFTVWMQGCSLGCPGCFNPGTHPDAGGTEWPVASLVDEITGERNAIEGVTISGGEPFEQPAGLRALVAELRARASRLSILVFSGFTRAEIERRPDGPAILAAIDVLVDGRYVDKRRLARELRGSGNQKVHLLTERYRPEEVAATPVAEIVIGADGLVRLSGVEPIDL